MAILEHYGFIAEATAKRAGKTINVLRDGDRCGYINHNVLRLKGALGYHFARWGYTNNACPPELADRLVPEFCERYHCDSSDLTVQHGSGANRGRTFLIINSPTVALRVLLQDAGMSLDKDVHITQSEQKFIEGAVRDVVMREIERSSKARQACLSYHGFDCFVCGVNLRRHYQRIDKELIQVHHEEPLATKAGAREVDPVIDLKPVCPNCRAVIHSKKPPYTIAEVKAMLRVEPEVDRV